jgi:MFS family permease
MSFTILTTYYGFITILPLVITNQYNLPTKEIPNLLLTASIGGLIGGIVVSFLSDKLGRKITGTTRGFIFSLNIFFLFNIAGYLYYSFCLFIGCILFC